MPGPIFPGERSTRPRFITNVRNTASRHWTPWLGGIAGRPDWSHISTSIIERQNLTMRMSMRRFTRLTNGFSKKIEKMKAAVSLHFAHYNFVRMHKSLRMTPAMAAKVETGLWSLQDLMERTSA